MFNLFKKKNPTTIQPIKIDEDDQKEIEETTQNRIKAKGKLFNDISEILFKHDPIGLNFDTNIDEYDYEADLILETFKKEDSVEDLTEKIYTIFVKAFDKKIARSKKQYKAIAEEILLLVNNESSIL